ncbi:MAG: MFS transporter [Bowdeniella nasicola]|nr:MFS transporter [Bowdeniella nasicola]
MSIPSLTRREFWLAVALIVVELISGMQIYLTQTILPILAKELQAQQLYGVITGVGMMATYMAMPIGAALLQKYRTGPLMLAFTVMLTLGSIISAMAPSFWVFLSGQIVRTFSGGALVTLSIGAVALGLQGRARRFTMAFMSASWVVAALAGPAYAALVTELTSWRWAMILYLPFLLLSRWLIARNLDDQTTGKPSPLPLIGSLLLGVGIGLTIIPVDVLAGRLAIAVNAQAAATVKIILVLAGVMVLGYAAWRILPPATFQMRHPRSALLVLLLWLMGCYFGGMEVIALTGHDVLGLDAKHYGLMFTASGLGWSLTAMLMGMRDTDASMVRRRVMSGASLISSGFLLTALILALTLTGSGPLQNPLIVTAALAFAQAMAGMGVGTCYIDVFHTLFTDPPVSDGLDVTTMAGASVIAEGIGMVAFVSITTTWAASAFGTGMALAARHITMWGVLALCASGGIILAARTLQR